PRLACPLPTTAADHPRAPCEARPGGLAQPPAAHRRHLPPLPLRAQHQIRPAARPAAVRRRRRLAGTAAALPARLTPTRDIARADPKAGDAMTRRTLFLCSLCFLCGPCGE